MREKGLVRTPVASHETTVATAQPASVGNIDDQHGLGSRGELNIGSQVSFHGKITACEVLIIEGSVDASLRGSANIEIGPSGLFIGHAETERADIAGRFEGDLVVRDRLVIRATGSVAGNVRYGRLEIECGGEITGDIGVISADKALIKQRARVKPR